MLSARGTQFDTPGADEDGTAFTFADDVQADQNTEIDRVQQMLDVLGTLGA